MNMLFRAALAPSAAAFLLLTLGANAAAAQQIIPPTRTLLLDSAFEKVTDPQLARYRREIVFADSTGGEIRDYFLNGKPYTIGHYEHINKRVEHGVVETWYEGGQLKFYETYAHGKKDGETRFYYPSGQLKRHETYAAGKRTSGECFRGDGVPMEFFEYLVMPVYPEGDGGTYAIITAVAKGVQYPADALRNDITGRVMVSFVVTKTGDVSQARVTKSVHPSLDAAALQAVNHLRRFTPGRCDGVVAAVSFTVPISFTIGAPRRSIFQKRTTYELPPRP